MIIADTNCTYMSCTDNITNEEIDIYILDGKLFCEYYLHDQLIEKIELQLRDFLRIKHIQTAERNQGPATQYATYGVEDKSLYDEEENK